MTDTIALADERALRQAFTAEDFGACDQFIAGVNQAARASADLAWLLATPVRSHAELNRDIARLMMRRLRKELRFHVGQLTARTDLRAAWTQLVLAFALSAFVARTLELEDAERASSLDLAIN